MSDIKAVLNSRATAITVVDGEIFWILNTDFQERTSFISSTLSLALGLLPCGIMAGPFLHLHELQETLRAGVTLQIRTQVGELQV